MLYHCTLTLSSTMWEQIILIAYRSICANNIGKQDKTVVKELLRKDNTYRRNGKVICITNKTEVQFPK